MLKSSSNLALLFPFTHVYPPNLQRSSTYGVRDVFTNRGLIGDNVGWSKKRERLSQSEI